MDQLQSTKILPQSMTLLMEFREMLTLEALNMPTMRTAMDTLPMENTVLLFLMAAPRLLPTMFWMPILAMLPMSSMRVSPSPMLLPQGLHTDQ
jgi:hypothetical protein